MYSSMMIYIGSYRIKERRNSPPTNGTKCTCPRILRFFGTQNTEITTCQFGDASWLEGNGKEQGERRDATGARDVAPELGWGHSGYNIELSCRQSRAFRIDDE